jgi:hypothetical protein
LNTWFNRAYLQECVQAMWAIKRSCQFKRVWLQALVHVIARAFKLACLQMCLCVIILFIKLVSVESSVQENVSSILQLCTHAHEYEFGLASLCTNPSLYVEACLRWACI